MSRDRIPYFDFYPSDFMHGVRGLSAQEVGVYTMMLCRIYEENGPVEFHVMRLSTYCGMRESTFVKTVEKLIELGKLQLVEGKITNHRAEAEISSRANKLKNNSKAGKASVEKRQQKQWLAPTDVQQPFNHTDTDTDTDITSSLRSDVSERAKKQDHVSEALEAYSALASRCGLPAVRVLNDARKRKLASLLKAHGLPVWLEALAKVEASDFCLGRKGDFRADLDFLLQQQSFTRLLEGRYDNRASAKPADPPPKPRNIGDAIRDEARRLGVLKDEPVSENRGFHDEGHSAGNVRVLDLAFRPSLKGFG